MRTSTLTLRGPADIAAALPSLLGFHPAHSIVIIAFLRMRIVLTMRIELPGIIERSWAQDVMERTRRVHSDALIVVVADREFHPEREYGRAAVEALIAVESDRELLDALMVGGGRWRSYLCEGECCPASGTAIEERDIDRVRCAMSISGQVVAEDRDAIRAEFASTHPVSPQRFPELEIDDEWIQEHRPLLLRTFQRLGTAAEVSIDDDVALLVSAMLTPRVRDALLWQVTAGNEDTQKLLLRNLATVMRSTPDECVGGVAVVAGLTAWLIGDGARGADACERALAANPTHTLAELLLAAMAAGLPPTMWREGIAKVSQEECWAGVGEVA